MESTSLEEENIVEDLKSFFRLKKRIDDIAIKDNF